MYKRTGVGNNTAITPAVIKINAGLGHLNDISLFLIDISVEYAIVCYNSLCFFTRLVL